MMERRAREAFRKNLKLAFEQFPSIAEGARIVGLNRQQVNKYLSGASFPSVAILRKIANSFGLEIDDLLLEHDEFKKRLRSQGPVKVHIPKELLDPIREVHDHAVNKKSFLEYFLGDYLVYTSNINSAQEVNASYSRVYQKDGLTFQKALSPQFRYGKSKSSHGIIKHDAAVIETGGLLHFLRFSSVGLPIGSIGLKIMVPSFVSSQSYMRGTLIATERARTGTRVPSPVLMKKISTDNILRTVRHSCGPFRLDDPTLDPVVSEHFVEAFGDA